MITAYPRKYLILVAFICVYPIYGAKRGLPYLRDCALILRSEFPFTKPISGDTVGRLVQPAAEVDWALESVVERSRMQSSHSDSVTDVLIQPILSIWDKSNDVLKRFRGLGLLEGPKVTPNYSYELETGIPGHFLASMEVRKLGCAQSHSGRTFDWRENSDGSKRISIVSAKQKYVSFYQYDRHYPDRRVRRPAVIEDGLRTAVELVSGNPLPSQPGAAPGVILVFSMERERDGKNVWTEHNEIKTNSRIYDYSFLPGTLDLMVTTEKGVYAFAIDSIRRALLEDDAKRVFEGVKGVRHSKVVQNKNWVVLGLDNNEVQIRDLSTEKLLKSYQYGFGAKLVDLRISDDGLFLGIRWRIGRYDYYQLRVVN